MHTNAHTVADVARRYDVHRNTVYNWIKNRRLKTVRVSTRRQYILPEEMVKFAKANLIEIQDT